MPKPLVVKTFRFDEDEWKKFEVYANSIGIEPAVLVRRLALEAVRTGGMSEKRIHAQPALF